MVLMLEPGPARREPDLHRLRPYWQMINTSYD